MTSPDIASLIDSLSTWPRDDLDELIEVAHAIEARRTGTYEMTADERASVEEGLGQARRGEFVSDQQMDAVWARFGA